MIYLKKSQKKKKSSQTRTKSHPTHCHALETKKATHHHSPNNLYLVMFIILEITELRVAAVDMCADAGSSTAVPLLDQITILILAVSALRRVAAGSALRALRAARGTTSAGAAGGAWSILLVIEKTWLDVAVHASTFAAVELGNRVAILVPAGGAVAIAVGKIDAVHAVTVLVLGCALG
jgi:hypothetical protein